MSAQPPKSREDQIVDAALREAAPPEPQAGPVQAECVCDHCGLHPAMATVGEPCPMGNCPGTYVRFVPWNQRTVPAFPGDGAPKAGWQGEIPTGLKAARSQGASVVEDEQSGHDGSVGPASPAGDGAPALREQLFARIGAELDRAYAKHGRDPWGRHEFYAILLEEVEELWDEVKGDGDDVDFEKELVQVAAMCFRYFETGDRYRTALGASRPPEGGT